MCNKSPAKAQRPQRRYTFRKGSPKDKSPNYLCVKFHAFASFAALRGNLTCAGWHYGSVPPLRSMSSAAKCNSQDYCVINHPQRRKDRKGVPLIAKDRQRINLQIPFAKSFTPLRPSRLCGDFSSPGWHYGSAPTLRSMSSAANCNSQI